MKNKLLKLAAIFAAKQNFKVAEDLTELHNKLEQVDIENYIKNLGVRKDSDLVKQIRDIKQQKNIYPRDRCKIDFLWWTAKRNALEGDKKIWLQGVKPDDKEYSFIMKVEKELNKRVQQAIKDYKAYPSD